MRTKHKKDILAISTYVYVNVEMYREHLEENGTIVDGYFRAGVTRLWKAVTDLVLYLPQEQKVYINPETRVMRILEKCNDKLVKNKETHVDDIPAIDISDITKGLPKVLANSIVRGSIATMELFKSVIDMVGVDKFFDGEEELKKKFTTLLKRIEFLKDYLLKNNIIWLEGC